MNPSPAHGPTPTNWREALMSLVASRIALIQLESKDAVGGIARIAALILAAVGCVFFGWTLILAGGISLVSTQAGWPWSYVALATAGIHLLGAFLLARSARSKSPNASFPVTRAEFQKDREWIENFQKSPKSNG